MRVLTARIRHSSRVRISGRRVETRRGRMARSQGGVMGRSGWVGLAVVTWLVLTGASIAARADEITCDGFALGYDGEAAIRKCSEARIVRGMSAVEVQQAIFADHSFLILIVYAKSEGRTYLPLRTPRELVDDGKLFSQTTAWKLQRSLRGFDVA